MLISLEVQLISIGNQPISWSVDAHLVGTQSPRDGHR